MERTTNRKIKSVYYPVMLCVAWSISLYIARVLHTGSPMYGFLVWNLFLAYIPFWASMKLNKAIRLNSSKWKIGILLCVWFGFLPNAPYILTDLFHLTPMKDAPVWFDLIMILFFAGTGFMLWVLSIGQIHKLMAKAFGSGIVFAAMAVIIILSGVGVYMGRYGRYNSWDLIFNPHGLLMEMTHRMAHPFSYPALYGFTLVFSLFLGMSYYSIWFFGKRGFFNES